jgi:hypothetical protein
MNEQLRRTIRHALRAAPTVALATGIVCPAALGDPGDLDPTFADVGRFVAPEGFIGSRTTTPLVTFRAAACSR